MYLLFCRLEKRFKIYIFSTKRDVIQKLIFMYKVTSKIRFDVLLGGGGGFMKNVAVTFSVPKSVYEWPLKQHVRIKLSHINIYKIKQQNLCASLFKQEKLQKTYLKLRFSWLKSWRRGVLQTTLELLINTKNFRKGIRKLKFSRVKSCGRGCRCKKSIIVETSVKYKIEFIKLPLDFPFITFCDWLRLTSRC